MVDSHYKIVYITPALYMAGGVERVLTLKANYFAEHFSYDITIILTEGKNNPLFYPLSEKIKIVNLDINFEELWSCSFTSKVIVYLKKQRVFKKRLSAELMRIRPDVTISLLRREINFINEIKDGSKKVGELHVNRANYRNFEDNETNLLKKVFQYFWMKSLVSHVKSLDRFVVLTHEDRTAWTELSKVDVIPDPLSFIPKSISSLKSKRVIAVGRYCYQKGFDLLLQVWAKIEKDFPDWELVVYGTGDREPYEQIASDLSLERCSLYGSTQNIEAEYLNSSLFVFSSRFEGFGMVLIEAMACGLPVVSFDCPCGPKDIVRDGMDGFLVKTYDIEGMADKLSSLMKNRDVLLSMSRNAVSNAQRYRIDYIAETWKSLFEETIKKVEIGNE